MKIKKVNNKTQASLPKERDFFKDVYDVVRQIPKGRVTSYGAIAKYLSTKSGARMVGWALSSSHSCDLHVPAQRVLNRNGELTGRLHFGTPTLMQELLEKEGVEIENNTVKHFSKLFWDPSEELRL